MTQDQSSAGTGCLGVIDDNDEFLELVRSSANLGPVLTTKSADDVISWAEMDSIDVLLSDWRMPIDGLELLERVREINEQIRLYLVTAYTINEEAERRLKRIGAEVHYKGTDFSAFLGSLASGPADSPDVKIDRKRLQALEQMHAEWVADLMADLEAIPDASSAWISGSTSRFSVAELIDDIRNATPRGIEHVRLWQQSRRILRGLKRQS